MVAHIVSPPTAGADGEDSITTEEMDDRAADVLANDRFVSVEEHIEKRTED